MHRDCLWEALAAFAYGQPPFCRRVPAAAGLRGALQREEQVVRRLSWLFAALVLKEGWRFLEKGKQLISSFVSMKYPRYLFFVLRCWPFSPHRTSVLRWCPPFCCQGWRQSKNRPRGRAALAPGGSGSSRLSIPLSFTRLPMKSLMPVCFWYHRCFQAGP